MQPISKQDRVKTTVVYSLYTLVLIRLLTTASLQWLSAASVFATAACVVKGNPVQLYRKRQQLMNEQVQALEQQRSELVSQAETLQEYEWQQQEQLTKLEEDRAKLQEDIEQYAQQLQLSATEQVQAIVRDYEHKLELLHDKRLLLENEVEHYKQVIEQLQAPRLPTASDPASLLATALCNQLNQLGTPVDFERVWYDSGEIVAWVKPRKGGIKAVSKHADSLHLALSLTRKPLISVVNGFVEVSMRPAPYSEEAPDIDRYVQGRIDNKVNQSIEAMRANLTNAWTKSPPSRIAGFIEPTVTVNPRGGISELERTWVLHCHYQQGKDKASTIYRVYGARRGNSQAYHEACDRYEQILKEEQSDS